MKMLAPAMTAVAAVGAVIAATHMTGPTPKPAAPPAGTAVVTKVVDGDTIHVQPGGTIRIRGIDTPETKKPGTPVQCGGPEASAYATRALAGQTVRLVTDPGDLHDRYGRTVAEVWLPNGHSYAADAVEAGMGRAYLFNKRHPASNWPAIEAAQSDAQGAHRGMWACPVR